jgi:hypothetical protein
MPALTMPTPPVAEETNQPVVEVLSPTAQLVLEMREEVTALTRSGATLKEGIHQNGLREYKMTASENEIYQQLLAHLKKNLHGYRVDQNGVIFYTKEMGVNKKLEAMTRNAELEAKYLIQQLSNEAIAKLIQEQNGCMYMVELLTTAQNLKPENWIPKRKSTDSFAQSLNTGAMSKGNSWN